MPKRKMSQFIGVISDTHGLVRPQALQELEGARLICHAGDIGKPEVILALQKIAPVVAVRGNNDRDGWAKEFPLTASTEIEGFKIYVLHDVKEIDLDPVSAGYRVVISGHSHHPSVTERNGVLFLNPGSAGPRRFSLPVTVARLEIDADLLRATLVTLRV